MGQFSNVLKRQITQAVYADSHSIGNSHIMMETPFSKPGRFWRGNLHTHSTRSDGRVSPEEVCRTYREAGYDFLTLSDHFVADCGWPITDTRPYRTPEFTTIIGAEIHTHTHAMELGNTWHILAVGLPFDFAHTPEDQTGPELAARALAAGAFVVAPHPHWYLMTDKDMLALGDIHAMEIFNASATDDNDCAESSYMIDYMLARGRHLNICATDDAHFVPNSHERLIGSVMVKSEELSPEALLAALKAGDFYSTTGPLITHVEVEPGKRLSLRCTPANRVFIMGVPTEYKSIAEQGITQAEFSLENWRSDYVRILVRDDAQRKAWSNPIWLR